MSEEVQRRIDRYRAEMIFQARLFPRIYDTFQRYLRRPAETPESLRALQRRRLTRMLSHARARVPAYHRDKDADGERDPWLELAGLPPVTKAALRERLSDHCDDRIDPRRCRSVKTSGTTGEPLRIVHDVDHLCHAYALGLVRAHRDGLPLDRRILYPFHTALDRWFEYTAPAYGLARIAEFGALGDEPYWTDVVARVRGYRPHVVVGHPTRCLELADLLEGSGGLGFRPPRLVSTWGERLSPGGARRLADFFQAPIRDSYGMSEVGTIASQCERGAYHIESERLWVEITGDTGAPAADGEIGEVVVTNLINRAMPLLRYRTGDLASFGAEPCPCGRPHRTLRLVEGREPGRLTLPGGVTVGIRAVALPLQALPLARYQIVEHRPGEVELIVAPLPEAAPELLEQARAQAQAALVQAAAGRVVRVTLRADGAFVRAGARKMKEFVSYVPGAGMTGIRGAT